MACEICANCDNIFVDDMKNMPEADYICTKYYIDVTFYYFGIKKPIWCNKWIPDSIMQQAAKLFAEVYCKED